MRKISGIAILFVRELLSKRVERVRLWGLDSQGRSESLGASYLNGRVQMKMVPASRSASWALGR
jgi:hypothetical protein